MLEERKKYAQNQHMKPRHYSIQNTKLFNPTSLLNPSNYIFLSQNAPHTSVVYTDACPTLENELEGV